MSRRFNSMPLGWRIVLGILAVAATFTAFVAIVSLCNGQSFVEGFKTLFGIAEKVVEETPAVENTAETVASIGIAL